MKEDAPASHFITDFNGPLVEGHDKIQPFVRETLIKYQAHGNKLSVVSSYPFASLALSTKDLPINGYISSELGGELRAPDGRVIERNPFDPYSIDPIVDYMQEYAKDELSMAGIYLAKEKHGILFVHKDAPDEMIGLVSKTQFPVGKATRDITEFVSWLKDLKDFCMVGLATKSGDTSHLREELKDLDISSEKAKRGSISYISPRGINKGVSVDKILELEEGQGRGNRRLIIAGDSPQTDGPMLNRDGHKILVGGAQFQIGLQHTGEISYAKGTRGVNRIIHRYMSRR